MFVFYFLTLFCSSPFRGVFAVFFFVFVYVCRGRGACGFFSLASHVFDFAIIPRRDRTRLRRDSDSNGQLCIEEKIGKKSNESKLFYIFLI